MSGEVETEGTTTCPACGGLVSRQAPTCVHCGQPLHPATTQVAAPSVVIAPSPLVMAPKPRANGWRWLHWSLGLLRFSAGSF